MQSVSGSTTPPVTWRPTDDQAAHSRLACFLRWVRENRGVQVTTYREAWDWSVKDLSGFWDAVREYFEVIGVGFESPALTKSTMPGTEWYPHARLNFAENVLRHASTPALADAAAIIDLTEDNEETRLSWRELSDQVAALAEVLREFGVRPGDCVGAILPNIPEAIVALLATAAVGAVWTVSSPELSPRAALDRMTQVKPKVLIGAESYRFGGRDIDCTDRLEQVQAELPWVLQTILVSRSGRSEHASRGWTDFSSLAAGHAEPRYERVAFDHPLWVLFSSGTTGLPKGVVHGHGGIMLESLKCGALNNDVGPGDIYYVAANTSWMVWNLLVSNMACGAAVVTYAGSPIYPKVDRQFEILARTTATQFATGAAYLTRVQQEGCVPGEEWDLRSLAQILSTGSPLPDSTWAWVHESVKADVHLGSSSGGTEICSAFAGSNPLEPVHLGELQGPALGVAVESWNDAGERVVGEVGELVIKHPMPSMPLRFLNDDDGSRYRDAYFTQFPGVWTHGDWVTETPHGGFVIHGRSDATLNRSGVRFGSGDIYSALEDVAEVVDALVVGVEHGNGNYDMPLFVVLAHGHELDEALRERIRTSIRRNASPRHVPDEIIEAPGVPMTHTGKKAEVPVKKLLRGISPAAAVSRGSLADPDVVDWYVAYARQRVSGRATAS